MFFLIPTNMWWRVLHRVTKSVLDPFISQSCLRKKEYVVNCAVGLPPMTKPNRVFCKHNSVWFVWPNLICPMHNDAKVGPALNNTSIGRGWWNSGSANRRFLGNLISDRSMGWSGTDGDIVCIIKNVTVRVYVPSMEVRVAVIWQIFQSWSSY
jgi:hypothetical protein